MIDNLISAQQKPLDNVKPRLTSYHDEAISMRHRNFFGRNLPCVNIDFLGIHYDRTEITDFVEFKDCHIKEINLSQANYVAIRKAADKLQVPFFIIVYDPENWSYWILQNNENPAVKTYVKQPGWLTEKDLILSLYKMRGYQVPAEVLQELSTAQFDRNKIPKVTYAKSKQ